MGGMIGLCGEGGPCMGDGDSDKHNHRRNNIEEQKLLPGDNSDTTNSDSLSIETVSKETKGFQSLKHNSPPSIVPTKKIEISPILSNYILPQKKFQTIRKQIELNALKLTDIDKIVFQNNCWLVQGSDSIELEKHTDLFDIIIWRVSIIPAFAHFTNETQLYNKLTENNEISQLNTDGIWALLSKEKFIEMFDTNILQQIDKIDDKEHDLLAHPKTFPKQKDEYKDLIDKLHVIAKFKKANEIIIIGQKICVIDLLRVIRQCEVVHESMSSICNAKGGLLEWELKQDDPNAPDPKFITSYYCIVSNVPLRCDQHELELSLSRYERWTYAEILDDDDDENENNEEKESVFVLKDKKAKIEFDVADALQKFVDDVEDDDGIYLGGNKLCLEKSNKEMRKRKRRRLYAGHMIV